MNARHGVAAALLLLALGTLWLWRCASPTPLSHDRLDTAHGAPPTAPPGRSQTADGSTTERSARTAPDVLADSVRARLVIVTARGEPAAGAQVYYWQPRSEAARQADAKQREQVGDLEAALQATGQVATADEQGCAEIVADPESQGCVRCGDAFGRFDLSDCLTPGVCDVRVVLQRDATLRVELVDSSGRPVRERIVQVTVDGVPSQRIPWFPVEIGPTDAAGVALLRHVLHTFDLEERSAEGQLSVQTHRKFSCAGSAAIAEQVVPIAALQRETTVRLTIPPSGTIVLRARDADGRPYHRSVWLTDENGDSYDDRSEWNDGEYTFRYVPCGRRWNLVISDGGMMVGAIDRIRLPVTGPRRVDEVVSVEVDVPVRSWQLRCRLVRSDGAPIAGARVVAATPALEHELVDTTDRHGLVAWFVRAKAAVTNLAPLTLRIEGPFCEPRTFVVDRAIPSGKNDLGEFVVEPPAAETLLASVELRIGSQPAPPGTEIELVAADGNRFADVPAWQRAIDGTVELRGVPPRGELLLRCSHSRLVCPPAQRIRVGERRIVELQQAASLRVAVLATGLPREAVSGSLTRLGEENDAVASLDRRQTMHWPRLAPGRYTLRILVHDREGTLVLHDVPSIELQPGENAWPPDGTRLDLRGKVQIRRIAAQSTRYGELLDVELLMVGAGVTSLPPEWTWRLEPWYVVPNQPHEVFVRAWGHVPVRVPGSGGDLTLHLQPCTWLALEGATATPRDKVRVRVIAEAVTDPLLRAFDRHAHAAEFEATDPSELLFAPGTVLELTPVRDGKPGTAHRVVVGNESPQTVTLR